MFRVCFSGFVLIACANYEYMLIVFLHLCECLQYLSHLDYCTAHIQNNPANSSFRTTITAAAKIRIVNQQECMCPWLVHHIRLAKIVDCVLL